jgi:hypothetical protein
MMYYRDFRMMGYGSLKHFLEDFIELSLLDLSVSGDVNGTDEPLDIGLADLFVGVHVLEGIADKTVDLIGIEGAVSVLVVFAEDGIHSILELLVVV